LRSSPPRSKGLLGLGAWGAALLLLGFAIRVGYGAYALRTGISESHSDEYETVAINLVEHRGYAGLPGDTKPSAAREPVFVLLIAALYAVFGKHPLLVLAAQSALNVGACVLLALLAARLSGRAAGRIALWIGLFYPYFVFYCAYFYRETVLTALVVGALYYTSEALRRPGNILVAAVAGGLWGLAAATMSTFLLVSGLIVLAVMTALVVRFRAVLPALALGLLAAIPPGAWISRNYLVFHRFIPGSTLGGYNLYTTLIVPEEDRGTERETRIEQSDATWQRLIQMSPLMTDDGSQQEAFLAAAKDYLKDHRAAYLKHMVKQAAKLWRFYPYERHYQHSYKLIKALSLLSDGWLIPIGLWGLLLAWRRGPESGLGLLLMALGTLAYALVAAIMRYRLPLMPPLIVGAAVALAEKIGKPLGIANDPEIGFH
jgi:4-amino-4-deoxy-L-arabinose transferase-like glycosyltransferase